MFPSRQVNKANKKECEEYQIFLCCRRAYYQNRSIDFLLVPVCEHLMSIYDKDHGLKSSKSTCITNFTV